MRKFQAGHRRLLVSGGAIVAGVGLFAAGILTAGALDNDGGGDDPSSPAGTIAPGIGGGNTGVGAYPAIAPSNGDVAQSGRGGEADMSMPGSWQGCSAPIPAVLKDGTIDPSLAGFAAAYLGSGFQLVGINVWGQADCDENGQPSGDVHLVIDSRWKHAETGLLTSVTQRQEAEATAAVLEESRASFWKDGYWFSVYVEGYSVMPVDAGGREPFAPGPDPRAGDVLRAALADLGAPAEACFYVARNGTWEDLAAFGVGDPRGAIPAGFAPQDAQIRVWTAPAAECNTPSAGLAINFNATWIYQGSDRQFGALFIGGSSVDPKAEKYPGYFGDYGANWQNGKFNFNVGFKIDPSSGSIGGLEAIAKALDPGFENACMMREVPLTPGDLQALGVGVPSAAGYTTESQRAVTTKRTGDCSGYTDAGPNSVPSLQANWQLRKGTSTIMATAYAAPPDLPAGTPGYISDANINWFRDGVAFGVSTYSEGGDKPATRETLIEVAKSMDSSFDPSKLQEQPGGAGSPPVKPMPASDGGTTR